MSTRATTTPEEPDREFVYHVDRNDIVAYCDLAWLRFAQNNAAPELDIPHVVGHRIWEFIATAETQTLYQLLMTKARAEQKPVSVSFRCDGPTCRRLMRLSIAPLSDDGLTFTSHLVEEEPRPYVALLDPAASRAEVYIKMCSWCKQVFVEGRGWLEVEDAAEAMQLFLQAHLPQITHAICEPCYSGAMAALE
ncbi:hypothetical protein EKD04_025470 [Chloroflexales bacterium ZM16-3]|nr:hypothetical protein [Chloroflexales bacterium ZM16-3]